MTKSNPRKRKVLKTHRIELRATSYEKRILIHKAKKAGLNQSEFLVACIRNVTIKERISEEQAKILKLNLKLMHNISRIANLIKHSSPNLYHEINMFKDVLRKHILTINK